MTTTERIEAARECLQRFDSARVRIGDKEGLPDHARFLLREVDRLQDADAGFDVACRDLKSVQKENQKLREALRVAAGRFHDLEFGLTDMNVKVPGTDVDKWESEAREAAKS